MPVEYGTDSIGSIAAPAMVYSPDTRRGDPAARTPPGQTLTRKWPVLHYGSIPAISMENWSLSVHGRCERPYSLNWEQFSALSQVQVHCDIHCVTHWSRLDNVFRGVPTRLLIEMARPHPDARFVLQHSYGDPGYGWTTNVPLDEFVADDCLLATHHDGMPLSPEHGAPVRAVVPRLYLWKGAKWISGIEIRETDAPGFWEVNGYHMHGDPWKEERYGW